jgi:hypothetical protein
VSDPFAGLANGLTMLLEVDAGEVFGDGLMRAWLAGQDEVAAALLDDAHDRLAGIEIVAKIDRPETGNARAMAGQPALGGGPFAILFFRPVLRRDELRRQRQDLGVTGRDHTGTEKGVEILHAAIRAPARRALRAADLARTEVLGAVERDQQSAVQALERRQAAAMLSNPLMNSRSKAAGELPSSIWRIWLSLAIAAMPSRVWQFDRPCPSASARWCPRNEGLCMKNTENAAMSAIVYRHACPWRLSSSPAQTSLSSDSSSSSALMPL